MVYVNLLVAIAFLLLFSLFSKPIEKTVISGPFLALVVGVLFGPAFFDILNLQMEAESFRTIAEFALALVLFGDASKTNLSVIKKNSIVPIRLLLVGLPLTIIFGMLGTYLLYKGFSWIEVGILATMLAPTDAALGKAVVSNPNVSEKIRESLNVESGLNDGISVPVLFLFIGLFNSITGDQLTSFYGIILLAKELGLGLVVGAGITYTFVWIGNYANKRDWITDSWQNVVLIMLVFTCFITAQLIGGSGFIACFAGGFLYGTMNIKYNLKMKLVESVEGIGDSLSLITWLIFGALIYLFIPRFTWEVLVYAMLSLTLIRILPVFIALYKTDLSGKEKLFIGWFGPRGLATIVFAVIVLDVDLPHQSTLILTVACVVMLSVTLHGLTAKPFIKWLGKK